MTNPPPIVELKQVCKWYPSPRHGERTVTVHNISFTIANNTGKGEFVVLLGPSGCGKSTLLNLVAGLSQPDDGEVLIMGKSIEGQNPYSVNVPQMYTCFPWLTVQGNAEFGLSILGKPPAECRKIASEFLQKVGLADHAEAYPKQLSGGMQQRVAIARTLAMQPPIILMDEPFGALDAQTRMEMQQMLLQLWAEAKNLVIFITHDITEALLLADRIIVLSPCPAEIIHDMTVPFPRPRQAALVYEEEFIKLSQQLLQLLKNTPTSGQIRMSV